MLRTSGGDSIRNIWPAAVAAGLALVLLSLLAPAVAGADVRGRAFVDYNTNGALDTGKRDAAVDTGLAGVTVTATNGGGKRLGSATTGADGSYTLNTPSDAKVRVEFSGLPRGYSFDAHGKDSGTSVQFVDGNATNVSVGALRPVDYAPDNPRLVTVGAFSAGLNGPAKGNANVWAFNHNGSNVKGIATYGQTGSLFGTAHNSLTGDVYVSAFMKRGVTFGPGGPGAIYRLRPDGGAPPTVLATIPNAGDDPHKLNGHGDGEWNRDSDSGGVIWNSVGKLSLGAIGMSPDDRILYVVNLNDRKLYRVTIAGQTGTPDAGTPIPAAPGCADSDSRPGGLGVREDGTVFVGVTCTNESVKAVNDGFKSYVFAFNPANRLFAGAPVLTIPMDRAAWPRKCANDAQNGNGDEPNDINNRSGCEARMRGFWHPWTAYSDIREPGQDGPQWRGSNVGTWPEPLLMNIQFDGPDLVLAFRDMTPDKIGWRLLGARPNDSRTYGIVQGGDIVRACAGAGGALALESNGACGAAKSASAGSGEGLGGGRFYVGAQHFYHDYTPSAGLLHIPGFPSTVGTAVDVLPGGNDLNAGGVLWLNDGNGRRENFAAAPAVGAAPPGVEGRLPGLQLYSNTQPPRGLGKANGMGDLDSLIGPPPLEIGNRVWLDSDRNGTQGSDERAISGVTLTLYNGGGNKAGETRTDSAGLYYFPAKPESDYRICISLGQDALRSLSPTREFANGSRTIDSDGKTDGSCDEAKLRTGGPGVNDHTFDFGFVRGSGSVGDSVWMDTDRDGRNDADELGVPNVTVKLHECSETGSPTRLVESKKTDEKGSYTFDGIDEGRYCVELDRSTLEPGSRPTKQNADGVPEDQDSDADPDTGRTGPFTVEAGKKTTTVDIGVTRPEDPKSSVGDMVFRDGNRNGKQDTGEPGVTGVTIKLIACAEGGAVVQTTKSNGGGKYRFADVKPGKYCVEFDRGTLPPGTTLTTPQAGGVPPSQDSDPAADTGRTPQFDLPPGAEEMTVDAGVVDPVLPKSALGDFVFSDNNANGKQDPGEQGVPDVPVKLLVCAENRVVATTKTDGEGKYVFDKIDAGKYCVEFTRPNGSTPSKPNAEGVPDDLDSDASPETGRTPEIDLPAGKTDTSVDFGIVRPQPQTASLGDFVFRDRDEDGRQDDGERGVPDVTVKLIACNDGSVLRTTRTNDEGTYLFDRLAAGQYCVEFDRGTLPRGTTLTKSNAGEDRDDSDPNPTTGRTQPTTLQTGDRDLTVDAGIVEPEEPRSALGDLVFQDTNQNGRQDTDEPGVPNVGVKLIRCGDGSTIRTSKTDGQGRYLFDKLAAGTYCVQFEIPTLPQGSSPTKQNAEGVPDTADSDAAPDSGRTPEVSLPAGTTNTTVDMGVVPVMATAALGDFVWRDNDNNGKQDANEPGVPDVTVKLVKCSDGSLLKPAVKTGADGKYIYEGLAPGEYCVEFDRGTLPAGTRLTTGNADGVPDDVDSDAAADTGRTQPVTLAPGDRNLTLDAGVVQPPDPKAALGDLVFADNNANGKQDTGEPGVPNATVKLERCADSSVMSTTTTDAQGKYLFDGLAAGEYQVAFDKTTLPAGANLTRANVDGVADAEDSDAATDTGRTTCITLPAGKTDTTWDAGVVVPGKGALGDRVFRDADDNGRQDPGEPGVPDVTVRLLSCEEGPALATTKTDAQGNYLFDNLAAGTYRVEFDASTLPSGTSLTRQNVSGAGAGQNSDADAQTGRTSCITLPAGERDLTWDAGIVAPRLRLAMSVNRSTVRAGQPLTFRLRVSNPTDSTARNVRICFPTPRDMAYVSSSAGGTTSGGRTCWTYPQLPPGAARTVSVTTRVFRTASPGPRSAPSSATSSNANTGRARTTPRIVRARGQRRVGVTG